MLFNKLKFILIFAVLLVAGYTFVATSAIAQLSVGDVKPVLSVPDADENTNGIQVYGIRAETVTFELTVTFQDTANNAADPPSNWL